MGSEQPSGCHLSTFFNRLQFHDDLLEQKHATCRLFLKSQTRSKQDLGLDPLPSSFMNLVGLQLLRLDGLPPRALPCKHLPQRAPRNQSIPGCPAYVPGDIINDDLIA